jgi:chromosome segregation ATPase
MIAKGKAEKQNERVEFAKYTEWCQNTIAETTKALDEEAEQILQLKADIEKATTDAEGLAEEVKELEAETGELEAEVESATAVRNTEKADYKATHADFSESIDAIARAITVLSSQGDVKQALLQVSSLRTVPGEVKRQLNTFLGIQESTLNSAPEANAYENQSGGIIGLLEKMLQKFEDQRMTLEKEEMSSKANYETLMGTLNDHIQSNKKAISSKVAAKAQKKVNAGTAKGDLSITENAQSEDQTTLSDTKAACSAASDEYEKNQNTRADEIEAIQKAVKILSSDAVSGAALLQSPKKGKVLAQLRTALVGDAEKARSVAAYLQAQAEKTGSR